MRDKIKVIPMDADVNEEELENQPGKLSQALDRWFHFTDRGSTAKQEIMAGLSVFLISVCALFMNIQVLVSAFGNDVPYCGIYLAGTLVAFVGTLLLGLVCNLPLVQTASLGLSTVFISTLGANAGLTYANVLALTFVSAVVYLIVTAVPGLKKFTMGLIPQSVRKVLPVVVALSIAYTSLNQLGVLNGIGLADLSENGLGGATMAPYMELCIQAGLIALVVALIMKKRGASTGAMTGMLIATIAFYLIATLAGGIRFSKVFTQNRIWIGINPDPLGEMYTIGLGLSELPLLQVFRQGFDFTGFTQAGGNVMLLFAQSVLTFLFLGLYESEGAMLGADAVSPVFENYEQQAPKALAVNAAVNVLAPILGAAPQPISRYSAVAAHDGGKTGLTSITCAVGYLIAMFTWLLFAIFSTYNASVPEYGHAGFVFPNVIYATFQIADGVMLAVSLGMLARCVKPENDDLMPYAMTAVFGVFSGNIVLGVAAGAVTATVLKLAAFRMEEIKTITIPNIVMTVLSAGLLLLMF